MTESRGPLTRRPIVTEGIFEKDGALVDLPKLVTVACRQKQYGRTLTPQFHKPS